MDKLRNLFAEADASSYLPQLVRRAGRRKILLASDQLDFVPEKI